MGHQFEPCDFVDVLEESVVRKSGVAIELHHGGKFTDEVRDVVTEDGQDYAIFTKHGRIAVNEIASARRADPVAATYAGKRGQ